MSVAEPAPEQATTATSPTPLADAVGLPTAPASDFGDAPGEPGRPLVGHTLQFIADARRLVETMRERHGSSFQIELFGYPVYVVGEPDQVREVLLDRDKSFSSRLGWHHAIGQLFARGLMLRDFDEHRLHRRIMQVAFRAEAMRSYAEMMNPLIERSLSGWPVGEKLLFYPAVKQLTLDLAAEVFLGTELGAEADRLNRAFVDSVAASIALIKKEVPPFAYWRGMRGRRTLESYFADQIGERRLGTGRDMFTQLCQATTDDGESFSDQDIVDHMIFLLMAAHDTTTSALTSMVFSLAQFPEWQDRLREEASALGTAWLGYEDRDRPVQAEWVFKEALRIYPPVPFIARRSVRECTLGGVDLPANAGINVSSLVTHFLPELWTDPHSFDPGRFSPERAEDKAHSHAWYPFGGGAHMCLGIHFAYLQVKAVVHQMVQRFRIRLAVDPDDVEFRPIPIPKPKNGLPVVLERID